MTEKRIKIFAIQFDIPLAFEQVRHWRGAIAEHIGWDDERFHNHRGAKEAYHYRYPQVHYRAWKGLAGLWAFGEGIEALKDLLLQTSGTLEMGGKPYELRINDFYVREHELKMLEIPQPYFLKNWLALNEDNFKKWLDTPEEAQKVLQLEHILAANIIAFAKAIHWQIPIRLEVKILQILKQVPSKFKQTRLLLFDISFEANILLPSGLGLGKSVSHGHGVLSCR
jgi:hypothetical protein